LATDLRKRYGQKAAFYDVSTIGPGDEFTQVIESSLCDCKVVLALIGRRWLGQDGYSGQRRIDAYDDWVRLEIELALRRNLRIVPLLVQGTKLPEAGELPESLRPLLKRNPHELSAKRWSYDLGELTKMVDKEVKQQRWPRLPKPVVWAAGLGLLVLILIGLIAPDHSDPGKPMTQSAEPDQEPNPRPSVASETDCPGDILTVDQRIMMNSVTDPNQRAMMCAQFRMQNEQEQLDKTLKELNISNEKKMQIIESIK